MSLLQSFDRQGRIVVAYDFLSGAMRRLLVMALVSSLSIVSASPIVSSQISQPDIVQEHWYHSYATLTLDLNAWADEHPDIVNLLVVGQTELGRNLWMLQISDWSTDNKSDGTKTVSYTHHRAHETLRYLLSRNER